MSEAAIQSPTASQSKISGLELRASGSPKALTSSISKEAAANDLNIEKTIAETLALEETKKDSPGNELELPRKGIKLSPSLKSLKTVAKKVNPKKDTKQEIKPPQSLLNRTAPSKVTKSNGIKRSSPITSAKTETQIKVTKSPRRGITPLKRPVEKGDSNRGRLPHKEPSLQEKGKRPNIQSRHRSSLKVNSVKSVISKDSSRRSSIRDDILRHYPFDSPLGRMSYLSEESLISSRSTTSRVSTSLVSASRVSASRVSTSRVSTSRVSSSRVSTISRGLKKSQKKPLVLKNVFWGPHQIRMLKAQPKEPELPKEHRVSVQAKPGKSLEKYDSEAFAMNPLSDFETKVEAESPVSEHNLSVEDSADEEEAERITFLQTFGALPDVEDLSSRESLDIIELPVPEDEFKYVAPVDGVSYESERSEPSAGIEEEMRVTRSVDFQSDLSSDITLDDLNESDEDLDKALSIVKEPSVEDVTTRLLSIVPRGRHADFDSSSTSSSDELRLANIEAIKAFLEGVIDQTVECVENPSLRLGRLLDPEKMIEELIQLSVFYQDQLQVNITLDHIVSDYFIKRKEFEFVYKPKGTEAINKSRFMAAISEFDHLLERQKETQRISDNLVNDLAEQEEIARSLDDERIKKFEAKARETLFKDGYDRLKYVTNELLRKMNKVRDELSDSRQELTAVQHQLASIKNKSEEMEDLGNGLRIHEYMTNQANNQSLSSKINERNLELRRLNDRMTYDIHAMAHLKNKEQISQNLLWKMKNKLESQEQIKKDLRDLLYAGMLRRRYVKEKIQNLRYSGCLMHYPDMLRDYDATVKHLQTKKKAVLQLRAEHRRLNRKVSQVEVDIADLANRHTSSLNASRFSLSIKKYSNVRT